MENINTKYSFLTDKSAREFYYPALFDDFKKRFNEDKSLLKNFSEELLVFLNNLEYDYLKKTKTINLNYETNKEELLEEITNFIISLEDKEIINEYAKIISNEESINIDNKENEIFSGNCITENKNSHITLIQRNTLEDFTILAHEFGHALEYKIYGNQLNDYIKYSFFEVSSYYFELLMMNHIEKNTNFNIPASLLIGNKINYISRYIWQYHLANYINSLNSYNDYLIKDYVSKSLSINCYNDSTNSLHLHNVEETTNLISSFMIACNLYLETINDKEKGLNKYKSLMTSPNFDLMEFLDYNSINFMRDNTPYELLKIQSEIAYKKLIK